MSLKRIAFNWKVIRHREKKTSPGHGWHRHKRGRERDANGVLRSSRGSWCIVLLSAFWACNNETRERVLNNSAHESCHVVLDPSLGCILLTSALYNTGVIFFLQILRNRQPPFGPDPLRFFGSRVECTALHHTQSARDLWWFARRLAWPAKTLSVHGREKRSDPILSSGIQF